MKPRGFTLVEVVLGVLTLAVAAVAIMGAYLGQVTLNEHARHLTLATHDANRVMERIREVNSTCGFPNATVPAAECDDGNCGSWDEWLTGNTAGRKSIQVSYASQTTGPNAELVVVSCHDQSGAQACNGALANDVTRFDPIRITVAICWRHRNRTLGECTWNGAALSPSEAVVMPANIESTAIDSPAMLSTLVTCRG